MNGWTKKSTNERDKRYNNKVGEKKWVDVVDMAHQVFCKIYYKASIIKYI